ncbi:MAG: acyl-ACP--UDP-N-acetylglucosamine O-acyltransferase [Phycisphaerales bacterium]|nr:acyl-ACP--UDP-N-acetylglucosamine O-acyltransferase [Phycisphaerales bacterium]
MPKVHPMAVVEKGAELADDVEVGPFAYIGPRVQLGPGCRVMHHASLEGDTIAGERNIFFPFSSCGLVSQDLKYRGSSCRLLIGDDNVIREHATLHIGTEAGGGITRVGNGNLLMVGAHVAHDCIIYNRCILANNVLLAGHVEVQDGAVISGAAALHHFVTVGKLAFIGGISAVVHDIPPFMIADGNKAIVRGLNRTGLRRCGYSEQQVEPLRVAWRMLYKQEDPIAVQAPKLAALFPDNPDIKYLLAFIERSAKGKYGRYRESLRGTFENGDDEAAIA